MKSPRQFKILLVLLLALAVVLPEWHVTAAQDTATPLAATPVAAGSTTYVDPGGRFSVPIPTDWTAKTVGDVGMLTSPEGGITIYALAIPGTDVAAAIARAWQIVEPGFALVTEQTVDVPASSGLPAFTFVSYASPDPKVVVQAAAREVKGTVYAVLIRADVDEAARRNSQVQTAALGIQVTGEEVASLVGVTPRQLTPDVIADVDEYVAATMQQLQIPGVAYAIVQNGKIVHAAGFGVRSLDDPAPVTPETLMMIGSATKPMTTTYMATVIDRGKMRWDEPVVDVLPSFALADAEATKSLRIRDLVCACTGVPRRDLELIFESAGVTAQDIIASLKGFKLFTPVGEAFQYSNQMVAAGGYIAAIADGGTLETAYDDYVAGMQRQVFDPLGMEETTFSLDDVESSGSYAMPHAQNLDGSITAIPLSSELDVAPIAPSGGIWSNVLDLSQFLIMQIDAGVSPDGNRIVSKANLTETWQPGVQIAPDVYYGLGWIVSDYEGQPLIYHDGSTLGFNAEIAFLPEAGIGIAIVANSANAIPLAEALRTRILQEAFSEPASADDGIDFIVQQQQEAFERLQSLLQPLDENAVAPFLGTWQHPVLGQVTLSMQGDTLVLDAGEFTTALSAFKSTTPGELDFITATPPVVGFGITLSDEDSTPQLIVRDPASTDLYTFELVESSQQTPVATPVR